MLVRSAAALLLVASLLLVGFFLFVKSNDDSGGRVDKERGRISHLPESRLPDHQVPSAASAAGSPVSSNAPPAVLAGLDELSLRRELSRFLEDLRAGKPRHEVLQRLAALKAMVHESAPDVAATALIAALRANEDAATGLSYVIGAEGVMAETPTYRTALLDLLGQTDPSMSSDYARELMANTGVADEYSLGLRNLGWANFQGRLDGELQMWFGSMLQRQNWRDSPTTGFLEAFDVAVATRSISQVAEVISAAPQQNSDSEAKVNRAAFVALDRMMVADPAQVIDAFRRDPSLLSSAPTHRASIMSRLDVRQPDQLSFLRHYLEHIDHGAGELEYFAEVFPNGNYFASYRLITPWQSGLSMEDIAAVDFATIRALRAWVAEPTFGGPRELLESILARLEEFAEPVSATTP